MNRRTFLKTSALGSTSLYAQIALSEIDSSSELDLQKNENAYHFKLGDFECICFFDGYVDYKPERFFSNAPTEQLAKVLSKHNIPRDSIITPYTYLYVNTGKHRVLVDLGGGDLTPNTGKLVDNIKSAGINPADIDTVFITHAHPDHIGGNLDKEGKPVYSNASYYIWKGEWDFWFSETAFEKTFKFFVDKAREQLEPVKDRMNLVDKESEILPGVHAIPAPGHTPGHMVVSFASGDGLLFYIGDTVLHPLHLEFPNWLPVYDIVPEKAAVSKKFVFDLISEKKAWVIGQHFPPFPSLGHVVKKGKGWQWQPVST